MKLLPILFLLVGVAVASAQPSALRTVNGQLYNIDHSTNWFSFQGKVMAVQEGIVILDSVIIGRRFLERDERIAIRNHPQKATLTQGKSVSGRAMRVGTHVYIPDQPDALWDCGIINKPEAKTSNAVPIPAALSPAYAELAAHSERIALLEKRIKQETAKDDGPDELTRAKLKAGKISINTATAENRARQVARLARIKPLRQEIADLNLRDVELRQRNKIPKP